MNIKDQIKEAFKNRRPLKSTWSQSEQPNIYSLDIFLQKSGYRLVDILTHDVNGKRVPELVIEAVKEDHHHPDISHDAAEDVFYIDVKKYGELDPSDVREVIKGYETALAVVDHLDKLDYSKLETGIEDDSGDSEENEDE